MSRLHSVWKLATVVLLAAWLASSTPNHIAMADTTTVKHYIVVFTATPMADGTYALGGNYALNHQVALSLIASAGGVVTNDLSRQIAVITVSSPNAAFADLMRASPLVQDIAEDYTWKAFQSREEVLASGATVLSHPGNPSPEQTQDPLEPMQWDMLQIQAPEAHTIQAGRRAVDVGILDTGIDGNHLDFDDDGEPGGSRNVDCARGRNSLTFLPDGPGLGTPDPCTDNGFHGTHLAGTVAAQANNHGIVGVAPNVTLVPVKVCDTSGRCYASAVVDGITYSGDQRLDVINMSFYVDDDAFQQSHEYKCLDDPVQRTFRLAVERAIQYARSQGVTPVASLGNSDDDLEHPPAPYENDCDVVPAETPGVIGIAALGPQSEKASYSNFGALVTDVTAPGGNGNNGDCTTSVLSTFPGNTYFCILGTSMAAPHATGVVALIISQFGVLGADGDVKMPPEKVEDYLKATTVDIGLPGYDKCFGNGRINALRAVQHDTSSVYDATAPFCPEYAE